MPFEEQTPREQLRRVLALVPPTGNQKKWNDALKGSEVLDIFENEIKLTSQLEPSFYHEMGPSTSWMTQDAYLMDVPFAAEGDFYPVMTIVPQKQFKTNSIIQMAYSPTAVYKRQAGTLTGWGGWVMMSGEGGGEVPMPRSVVTSINGREPDASGNVNTDFRVVDAVRADVPWTEYQEGKTEYLTEYKADDYPQARSRSAVPGLELLPEGEIVVRTVTNPEKTACYQTVEATTDGVFQASFARVGNSDGSWGPLVETTSMQGPPGAQGEKGDKGDPGNDGLPGVQGPVGPMGPRGYTGDKGDTGERGPQGLQGPKGDTGPRGVQGIQGPAGEGPIINRSYKTVAALLADGYNPNVPRGAFVVVNSDNPDTDPDNGKVYMKTENGYQYFSTFRGLKGETGQQGVEGPAGSIGPRGLQGVPGPQGIAGPKGPQGNHFNYRGTKANEGGLPLTGQPGDAFFVESEGRFYFWTEDLSLVASPDWLRGPVIGGGGGGSVPNATTTTKGIVQVGDGLLVTDGIIRLNRNNLNSTTLPVNATFEQYNDGVTLKRVIVNGEDPDYIYFLNLLNRLLGTNYTALVGRFYLETSKGGAGALQTIKVISNSNDGKATEIFQISRSYHNGAWSEYKLIALELEGLGTPENEFNAIFGCRYTDLNTNINYIKNGSKTTINANGWVALNAPKEYLTVKRASTNQSITAAGTILNFNEKVNGNIPYDVNTFEFTLTAGKVYRITATLEWTFSGALGFIDVALTNSSGGSATNYEFTRYIPTTSASHESTHGPFDTIFSPTTTGKYRMRVSSLQQLTATLKNNYSRLVIQEI